MQRDKTPSGAGPCILGGLAVGLWIGPWPFCCRPARQAQSMHPFKEPAMPASAPSHPTRHARDDSLARDADLVAAMASNLRRTAVVPAPAWQRLGARVAASAAASQGFLTVRRETYRLDVPAHGARRQLLRDSASCRVELVQVAPLALVPSPPQSQELLLLDGTLTTSAGPDWVPHQHGLRTGDAAPLRAGPTGARLYLRTLQDTTQLPPQEAAWWASEDEQHPADWWPLSDGVDVKRLRGRDDVLSMLVRMQPGAALGDHGHAIEEDCLMLAGELFLGDILLRADDYHLAPAGARHVDGLSETGALLFVHGRLPD